MPNSLWRGFGKLQTFFSGRDYSYGVIPLSLDKKGYTVFMIRHGEGHWGIPKGHPEFGEKPLQTAQRELKEETGLETEKIFKEPQFYEKYSFTSRKRRIFKIVTYFLGEIKDKRTKLQASEIGDGKWLDLEEAIDVATFQPTKQVLKDVQKYLEKNILPGRDTPRSIHQYA
jgi:bis(5'-nucleosidyl)-tetraphosphatase